MKKHYLKPDSTVIVINFTEGHMLSDSETKRNVDGGPTDDGGLPGTVGETDGETDPYSDDEGNGHGQGSGGSGNRGKIGGGLWDDIDDDY